MNKEEKYRKLIKEATALIDQQVDDIANMANITQLVMQHFDHHWVGFYRVVNDELLLGPFAGPVACTRIGFGKGVCGTAWEQEKTIIVDDVHAFPGHIACSALSNSEIVVPCVRENKVYAVLDIDSETFSAFEEIDQVYLEKLVSLL